jgi:hypothetical protein
MVMPWHKSDFLKIPDEERARAALKGLAVGYYMMPYCKSPADLKDEAMRQKFIDGPLAYIVVAPTGLNSMTPKLVLSFLFYVVVGVICAYVVSRTLAPGTEYLQVFRIAGTTAFIAYGLAYVQESIWFSRPWSITIKNLGDALLYGLLTGGTFGWLAGSSG